MNQQFQCPCGEMKWQVYQTDLQHGYIRCDTCHCRILFDLVTIEYTA